MAPGEAEVRCGSNSALARYPLHFRLATISGLQWHPRERLSCAKRRHLDHAREAGQSRAPVGAGHSPLPPLSLCNGV